MFNPLILPLFPKGRPDHPRYVVTNQHRQFWMGNCWSQEECDGLLFADETDAGWARTEILTELAKGKLVVRFVAPLEEEIRSDCRPDLSAVQ